MDWLTRVDLPRPGMPRGMRTMVTGLMVLESSMRAFDWISLISSCTYFFSSQTSISYSGQSSSCNSH